MASSGTVTYRANALVLIKASLRLCSAYDSEGSSPSTQQIADALEALNMLVKGWESNGLQLWERKYGVIFPQQGQGLYVLGSPGPAGDHASLTTPLNGGFVQTTLSTDAASGATAISVTSITGQLNTVGNPAVSITNGYYIGIQLDDGSTQWTTVNGAPSGLSVPLTIALTGAAASGNYVFCYQTKLVRPLRILSGFIRQAQQNNDTPMRLISKDEYNMFGMKSSTGTPVNFYYDAQVNSGNLYLYPCPSLATQLIFIEFQRPIDDFATSTDDFDLPQEWAEALKYNLAYRIAPEYEVTTTKYNQIKEQAKETFDMLNNWDQEIASVYLSPTYYDYSNNGR